MEHLQQSFSVKFEYQVFFTRHLFDQQNPLFKDFLKKQKSESEKKIYFIVDSGVTDHHPSLLNDIRTYCSGIEGYRIIDEIRVIPGGEGSKNTEEYFYQIINAVDQYGIDRHSYIVAVGGGSVLDLVGYAAAVSHRGIRHIRIPTTVLSQNDSGVGVKNGINFVRKKNFLGTFAPPVAVFNDYQFLTTLSDAEWSSGMSEAVKVALIKDVSFFQWLRRHAKTLHARDEEAMRYLVRHCARLHLEHIAGGDPFEMGSSRPLDFGHWSAHKTEQLSDFTIRHGEAVSMGIALDTAYSYMAGMLKESEAREAIQVLVDMGLPVKHELMTITGPDSPVLKGLDEFREHLGGRLTIMLIETVGRRIEVHELDTELLIRSSDWIRDSF